MLGRSNTGFELKIKLESFHMGHAGFWKRLVAAIIDGFAVMFLAIVLRFFLGLCVLLVGLDSESKGVELILEIFGALLMPLYFILMEASSTQSTLGKLAMGIFVCDGNGNRLTIGRAALRYFSKILSALILGIGFLMAAFTENKQALHDKIANCYVMSK
ncbi:RDD family protein [Verrucomicrobia bacterium]|nr:RDD family protein [Verrucomicrobiota bacterium]